MASIVTTSWSLASLHDQYILQRHVWYHLTKESVRIVVRVSILTCNLDINGTALLKLKDSSPTDNVKSIMIHSITRQQRSSRAAEISLYIIRVEHRADVRIEASVMCAIIPAYGPEAYFDGRCYCCLHNSTCANRSAMTLDLNNEQCHLAVLLLSVLHLLKQVSPTQCFRTAWGTLFCTPLSPCWLKFRRRVLQ